MADNTAATALTFTNDSTAPAGGPVDTTTALVGTGGRYSTSTSLSIAFTAASDSGAGLATGAQLLRDKASLTNGSCGSYSADTQAGANDPTSPVADSPPSNSCYRYRYVVSDRVGNEATYTSPDIKIDTTVPAAPTFAYSVMTRTYGTGSTIYYKRNSAAAMSPSPPARPTPTPGSAATRCRPCRRRHGSRLPAQSES